MSEPIITLIGAAFVAAISSIATIIVAGKQSHSMILPAEMTLIVESWREELARLRPLVTALDTERGKLQTEIAALRAENFELRAHLVTLKQDLDKLREQIAK